LFEVVTDIEEGEEVYEVEQILKHKKRGQGYEYLIKWVSYPITKASWEPKSNLTGATDITKNSTSCKLHAVLWKIQIYSKSLLTKPCTLKQP
jgi:Chromo (CHRromatin Organisation MOdifier) domain